MHFKRLLMCCVSTLYWLIISGSSCVSECCVCVLVCCVDSEAFLQFGGEPERWLRPQVYLETKRKGAPPKTLTFHETETPCSLENIPQPQVRSLEQKPQVEAGYGAFIHSFIPVIRRSFQRHKASLNWTTLRLLLANAHVPALPAGVFWSQELAATLPHLLISPLSNSLYIFLFGMISSDVLRPSSAGTLLPSLFS